MKLREKIKNLVHEEFNNFDYKIKINNFYKKINNIFYKDICDKEYMLCIDKKNVDKVKKILHNYKIPYEESIQLPETEPAPTKKYDSTRMKSYKERINNSTKIYISYKYYNIDLKVLDRKNKLKNIK